MLKHIHGNMPDQGADGDCRHVLAASRAHPTWVVTRPDPWWVPVGRWAYTPQALHATHLHLPYVHLHKRMCIQLHCKHAQRRPLCDKNHGSRTGTNRALSCSAHTHNWSPEQPTLVLTSRKSTHITHSAHPGMRPMCAHRDCTTTLLQMLLLYILMAPHHLTLEGTQNGRVQHVMPTVCLLAAHHTYCRAAASLHFITHSHSNHKKPAGTLCWDALAGFKLYRNPSPPHDRVLLECTCSQCWVLCRYKRKQCTGTACMFGGWRHADDCRVCPRHAAKRTRP